MMIRLPKEFYRICCSLRLKLQILQKDYVKKQVGI